MTDEEARKRLHEAVRIFVSGALRVAAKEQMRLKSGGENYDQTSGPDANDSVLVGGDDP